MKLPPGMVALKFNIIVPLAWSAIIVIGNWYVPSACFWMSTGDWRFIIPVEVVVPFFIVFIHQVCPGSVIPAMNILVLLASPPTGVQLNVRPLRRTQAGGLPEPLYAFSAVR